MPRRVNSEYYSVCKCVSHDLFMQCILCTCKFISFLILTLVKYIGQLLLLSLYHIFCNSFIHFWFLSLFCQILYFCVAQPVARVFLSMRNQFSKHLPVRGSSKYGMTSCAMARLWAQLVGGSHCRLKYCGFNSLSGHIPRLQVQSLIGRQPINISHINVSLSLSLTPLPLSLKAIKTYPQVRI